MYTYIYVPVGTLIYIDINISLFRCNTRQHAATHIHILKSNYMDMYISLSLCRSV